MDTSTRQRRKLVDATGAGFGDDDTNQRKNESTRIEEKEHWKVGDRGIFGRMEKKIVSLRAIGPAVAPACADCRRMAADVFPLTYGEYDNINPRGGRRMGSTVRVVSNRHFGWIVFRTQIRSGN